MKVEDEVIRFFRIYKDGWYKTKRIEDFTESSRSNLLRILNKLVKEGFLEKSKIGNSFQWKHDTKKYKQYQDKKENEKFVKSLKKWVKKLRHGDGTIEINQLMYKVSDEVGIYSEINRKFSRLFWKNEGVYYFVVSKKRGLPNHREGIYPDKLYRLYKIRIKI